MAGPSLRIDRPRRPAATLHAASRDELAAASGYAIGVDLGGTNTKLGLVDPTGGIIHRETVKTATLENPRAACESFRDFATDALQAVGLSDDEPVAVGVAVPGILDTRTGLLEYVANLPDWCEFPLRQTLQSIFEGPVAVANDANAAAIAEHSRRQLADESLALLTLGTGIGCGTVIGGRPFNGDHGCGFEVGHVPVDLSPSARMCGCDRPGHVEAYVGAAGVLRTAREVIAERGESSLLNSLCEGGSLSPRRIAAAAERGCEVSLETVHRTARWVGLAVALLCQTLDPTFILLGGAMTFGGRETTTGRRFLEDVIATNTRYSLDSVVHRVVIDFASLGNDAGICGISELARQGAMA